MVFFSANSRSSVATSSGRDADPVPQLGQPAVQVRLELRQTPGRAGRGRVDDGAGRQHDHHRLDRAVGVQLGAALHARGVVGDHAADGAGDLAGRVRSEPAAVARQPGVDRAHRDAGLHAHAAALVEHLDALEVRAGVDQHRVAQRLSRQRGASATEGERSAEPGAGAHDLGDVQDAGGGHQRLRVQQVVRGVVCPRQQVERTPGHSAGGVTERPLAARRPARSGAPLRSLLRRSGRRCTPPAGSPAPRWSASGWPRHRWSSPSRR